MKFVILNLFTMSLVILNPLVVDSFGEKRPNKYANSNGLDGLNGYEDDILLNNNQMELMKINTQSDLQREKRKFGSYVERWDTDSPIKYVFHENLKENFMKKQFLGGVKMWEDNTCLKFQRLPYSETYHFPHITVKRSERCSSVIGMQYNWEDQVITLADSCNKTGHAAHEIGHTLGLWHEQNRSDRDKYIKIILTNLNMTQEQINGIFKSTSFGRAYTDNYGMPYDHGSIMQYPSMTTSKYEKWTIKQLEDEQIQCLGGTLCPKNNLFIKTMGQRTQLSFYDAKIMNKVHCSDTCKDLPDLPILHCKNKGYPDPANGCKTCRCPDGLQEDCSKPAEASKDCGDLERIATEELYGLTVGGKRKCNYLIKAPEGSKGRKIHIYLDSLQFEHADPEARICDTEYIQFKDGDLGNSGFRECTNKTMYKEITSTSDKVLIIYKGFHAKTKVELRYAIK